MSVPEDRSQTPRTHALVGGRVLAMEEHASRATAIAWRGDEVIAVGEDRAVLAMAGVQARDVVDLGGRTVVPGLTDAHAHLDRHTLGADLPGFEGCHSRADVLRVIADEVRRRTPGEWIVTRPVGRGRSYEDARVGDGSLVPTRFDLDAVAPDNPVYIRPIWGYWNPRADLVSVANTAALRACGLDPDRVVSPSASVSLDRDDRGRFTGIFVERTRSSIVEHSLLAAAPAFDVDQRSAAIAAGWSAYASHGTTAYYEGHGLADELLTAYRASGPSLLRGDVVWSPDWLSEDPSRVAELWRDRRRELHAAQPELRLSGLFVELEEDPVDTRLRARPQTGWAGFSAGAARDEAGLLRLLVAAAEARMRVSTIDIRMLPLFEQVNERVPINGLRWVIGHVPVITPAQVDTIARLGIVVTTIAPYFLHRSGDALARTEGAAGDILPLPRLRAAGVPVAFGSDNVPISLWESLWAVTERRSSSGRLIDPQHAVSRYDALRCATWGGAVLMGQEDRRGVLRAGMAADFAVLADDPLTCSPETLRHLRADVTVVAGRCVHGAVQPD